MRPGTKLGTLIGLLIAVVLIACGDNSDQSGPATDRAAQPQPSSPPAGDDERSPGSGDREGEPSRGGEASIEDFGSEAGGADRGSIEGAFVDYMNAIASKDYGTACSYLSATVQRGLEQFVPPDLRAKGCTAILPNLLAPAASAVARQQANGEITKIRVDGDRSFVIFRAPGAELYHLPMVLEDGQWKADLGAAAVLVPDL